MVKIYTGPKEGRNTVVNHRSRFFQFLIFFSFLCFFNYFTPFSSFLWFNFEFNYVLVMSKIQSKVVLFWKLWILFKKILFKKIFNKNCIKKSYSKKIIRKKFENKLLKNDCSKKYKFWSTMYISCPIFVLVLDSNWN